MGAPKALTWRNSKRLLSALVPWDENPRQISEEQARRLSESLTEFGQIHPIAIDPKGQILDGHQRTQVWGALNDLGPDHQVAVRVASRQLTNVEHRKLVTYLHATTTAAWDWNALAGWDMSDLAAWGLDDDLLAGWNDDAANLRVMLEAEMAEKEITERTEKIVPREMARVLVSIPVDLALDARVILSQLESIEGVEILYGAN